MAGIDDVTLSTGTVSVLLRVNSFLPISGIDLVVGMNNPSANFGEVALLSISAGFVCERESSTDGYFLLLMECSVR